MTKPLVSFLLTSDTVATCFRQSDLDRLAEECEVRCTRPEKLTEELKVELAGGADVLVTGWGTGSVSDAVLDAAPGLGLIAHSAGSTRTMFPDGFWTRGVRLMTTNDALGRGVAEMILGLMIAAGKRYWRFSEVTRTGDWRPADEVAKVKELFDMTVGVVSASRVGRHLMRLLRGFEVDVLLYDPYVTAEQAAELGASKTDLVDLCRRCDWLDICAPNLPDTQKLINAEHFAVMKDDCTIVNTSRGAVIDEPALIAELERGRFFACLDVTNPEPPAPDSPLRRLPNVVLTPHIAGHSANGRFRQGRDAVDDILRFVNGEALKFEVTEQMHRIMA